MTDRSTESDDGIPANPPTSVPPAKPRKRRRWLKILGGLLVLLLVLVALLPTIISLGPVRSFAAGKASSYINGKIEIAAWSFGWFSPIRIQGVKVYDSNNALVLEADEIKTDLTLAKLARQQFALGETVVDANLARLQIRPDGSTNLQDVLVKPSRPQPEVPPIDKGPAGSGPPTQPEPAKPIEVPNVSCFITLKLRGTVELLDAAGRVASVVQLRQGSGGKIDVPDINQPVTTDLKFVYDVDNKPPGTITLAGNVGIIQANKIDMPALTRGDLDSLTADLKLGLAGVDTSAAKSALVMVGRPATDLAGVVNGTLAVKADRTRAASAAGIFNVTGFALTDPSLNGDTLSFATIAIPIDIQRVAISGGDALITPKKFRIETPDGFIDLAGEVHEVALRNLAAGNAPGSKGWLSLTADFPGIGALAKQLKNTAKLLPGVTLTQGRLANRFDLALSETNVVTKNRLDVALDGTDADGKAIAVKPMTVTADLTLTPGPAGLYVTAADGRTKSLNTDAAMRGLTEIAFVVVSDFADVNAGGKTLARLNAKGNVDLGKLRDQVAQFSDLGDTKLAGRAKFALATDGDLAVPNSPLKVVSSGGVEAIDMTLAGNRRVRIGFAAIDSNVTLLTGRENSLSGLQTASATFSAGDQAAAPLAKGKISAERVDFASSSVGRFAIDQVQVTDLPALVRMIAPFVPQIEEQRLDVMAGEVYLAGGGSYDGVKRTLTLDKPLSLSTPNLTLARAGQRLLNKENIRVEIAGVVGLPGDEVHAKFDTLTVSSSFASLKKSAEPFELNKTAAGVSGGGSIPVSADLVAINRLVTALGATATVTPAAVDSAAPPAVDVVPPEVTSGKFDGVLQVLAADAKSARLQFDGTVKELSIAVGPNTPIADEAITISASAVSGDAFGNVAATANVKSSFFTATLKDTAVNLAPASKSPFDQVTSATVAVGSPDLARLFTLAKAFVPSLSSSTLEITSGGAAMNLALARDPATRGLRLSLTDGAVSKLGLRNGEYAYAADSAKPITFSLTADATAGATLESVKVTQLALDARVAQLTMPEAIMVTDLATAPKASGRIVATGDLEQIAPLLSALQGAAPMKYAGLFRVEQAVVTAGDNISLRGRGTVDNFAVRDEANQPTFTEKQVTFANDLAVDTRTSSAQIRTLTLAMPASGALDMKIVGGVTDWVSRRAISPGTTATINYDLEKLWPIVYASMSTEQQTTFKDAKVLGKYSRVFNVGGAFPAAPRWQDSIKSLTMDGRLAVQLFDAAGVTLGEPELDLGVKLAKGQLVTDAKPAGFNGGTLNFNGLVATFSDDIRVDVPRNHDLIANASINSLLGDTAGKYINPVFAGAERAKGLLSVRIAECKALAVGEMLHTPQSGSATIAISIVDMDIANPVGKLMFGKFLDQAGSLLKNDRLSSSDLNAFQGAIRQGVIRIENGRTTQEITMDLSRPVESTNAAGKTVVTTQSLPLSFKGDIRLSDLAQKLSVNVPTELLASMIPSKDVAKVIRQVFPQGVPLEMAGTTTAPKVDYGNIGEKIARGLVTNGLTGGGDDKGKDLLGGLIDKLDGGKKDKKTDKEKN